MKQIKCTGQIECIPNRVAGENNRQSEQSKIATKTNENAVEFQVFRIQFMRPAYVINLITDLS